MKLLFTLEECHRLVVFRSGSVDGGRRRDEEGDRRRRAWRRPTLQLEEQAEEEGANYAMPASSTLYDDAAGLKLFLDVFPDLWPSALIYR